MRGEQQNRRAVSEVAELLAFANGRVAGEARELSPCDTRRIGKEREPHAGNEDRRDRHERDCAIRFAGLEIEDDALVGIVSIGDLVKARIDLLEAEREQLQSYIAG